MTRALIALILVGLAGVASAHPAMNGKPCVECHADAHHGEFAGRPDAGACVGCHTTTGWTPSTFGVAQHATTKYVLDGKHVATPCSACHPGKPRTSFIVAGTDCLDCHQNPHAQKFATQQATGGCAGCHSTFTWKSWKVDHQTWPLTGGHARAACAACHPGKTIDSPVAAMRGIARECVACHADRHAGQFTRAPAKACTTCHDTEAWATPKFDHARTKYPLEGVHVGMPCARCHKIVELRNGEKSVAWRLGYAQCKDCHANPHPATTVDCKGCHAATSWKPLDGGGGGGFDHDKTGFALRASHAKASCTKCHDGKARPKQADQRTSSSCQSCHPDPHQGRMAGQCFECHTAVAWQDVGMFEQHRRTRMPLTGKHAVIECGACHRRQAERAFRDLPTDCFGCHAKKYAAALNHTGQAGEAPYSRLCSACHVTTGWLPALDPDAVMRKEAKRRDHDRVFALTTGSHRSATCEQCHADPKRQRLVRCDGCHAAETLRTQHAQPVALVAATCLRCHPRGARR
jgi:hypothetical protein